MCVKVLIFFPAIVGFFKIQQKSTEKSEVILFNFRKHCLEKVSSWRQFHNPCVFNCQVFIVFLIKIYVYLSTSLILHLTLFIFVHSSVLICFRTFRGCSTHILNVTLSLWFLVMNEMMWKKEGKVSITTSKFYYEVRNFLGDTKHQSK